MGGEKKGKVRNNTRKRKRMKKKKKTKANKGGDKRKRKRMKNKRKTKAKKRGDERKSEKKARRRNRKKTLTFRNQRQNQTQTSINYTECTMKMKEFASRIKKAGNLERQSKRITDFKKINDNKKAKVGYKESHSN